MPAAFRPRFRRGAAGAESDRDPVDGPAGDEDGCGEAAGSSGGAPRADGELVAAGDEGGDWLAYELHEWSLESRVMLQQLLTVDKVVHSWQGTTLMVHESLEAQVDSLVDEVEETEKAKEAISRPIGPEDSLIAFELSEWPEPLRAELVERLVQASVPHILDVGDAVVVDAAGGAAAGGDAAGVRVHQVAERAEVCDLLVREADEERVEVVIDDLLAREEEAHLEELDGLEVNSLLSDLFVACDRLRRDPGDPDGVRGVVANARRLVGVRTPFGFAAAHWRALRNSMGELLDSVEDEDTDRDDLREMAHRMSDTLRVLV